MKKWILFFILPAFSLSAETWKPIPLITQEMRDAGVDPGGEGCQVILTIDIAPANHDLMLMGTNTGGIFRSENGGELWEPCNLGFNPRGCGDFEFDPKNENRVIAVGDAAGAYSHHGIYLSTDAGQSWRAVLQLKYKYNNPRNQLAWDITSYNESLRHCTIAYWAFAGGTSGDPAIYKTIDGGETWNIVCADFGHGTLDINSRGELFYAGAEGLFVSKTGGESFEFLYEGLFTGVDILPDYPDHIYACTETDIVISKDGGAAFDRHNPAVFQDTRWINRLTVSPANPDQMLVSYQYKEGWWQFRKYRSTDGGLTWKSAENYDNTLSFTPRAERDGPFEWHPAQPDVVYSVGGDVMYKSSDGGAHWAWFNNGNNGVMGGSSFNFNPHTPDVAGFGFQDKNGAVTTDGGHTWAYRQVSGKSWGHCYGGFSASQDIFFGGLAEGWGGQPRLTYTLDGGKTWTRSDIEMHGKRVSYQDPGNESILFCYEMRSANRGLTWEKMIDCDGVFTHNPETNTLFGAKGNDIVTSNNGGTTWNCVTSLPGAIADLATDPEKQMLHIVIKDHYYRYYFASDNWEQLTQTLPADQFGKRSIRSVAVDPQKPSLVYLGMTGTGYCSDTSVLRSENRGDTWAPLTRAPRHHNEQFSQDGGRMANWLRVHPVTRELWVMGGCYGIWKIGAPGAVTAIMAPEIQPENFQIIQNYPNPFNPATWIQYKLAEKSTVTLSVYDVQGKKISCLINEIQTRGIHRILFDATPLAAGIYYGMLQINCDIHSFKMVLLK